MQNCGCLQAYWGVFCAFADPLGEVMGAYLSQPVTEKAWLSLTRQYLMLPYFAFVLKLQLVGVP